MEDEYVLVRRKDLSLELFGLFGCDDDYIGDEITRCARAALVDALIRKNPQTGKLDYTLVHYDPKTGGTK